MTLVDRSLAAALAGRYTLERELGRGGMATVYLAHDLKHDRRVAVKVLHRELASLLGPERFLREIRITAGLQHPHILPVFDSGEAVVGRPTTFLYYVMPFVQGASLRQHLEQRGPLPLQEALRFGREVAGALDYAHRLGLVHRDVKPENVLLSEGHALLADFGIVRSTGPARNEALTQTGMALGTPAYMSPEQAMGEAGVDGRTDIYALGCLVYELLAGRPPYAGPTAQAVVARHLTEPVPSLQHSRPDVPAAIAAAVARAMAKDPAERFPTAAAFAEALGQAVIPPAAAQTRRPSVAVLPFLSLSADSENEFFADGITEDVIAQISKIRSLKVISRTSVMPYKKRELSLREIGVRLGVETVLEGSVRRAGDRVRIVAQLIDAGSDRHLWAETYDRSLTDIFAIQSDVALQIASALEAELSPEERHRIGKEPTRDVEAYQLYLLGRHCMGRWTQEGVEQGLEYLEQAVARDPTYALAYATIANAYTEIGIGVAGTLPPDEAFRRAKAAVARALELDGGLAEAHAMLAYLKYVCDYDWAGAEAEFRRAIELNPNSGDMYDAFGRMLAALERYDEALEVQRRAHELDPLAHRLDIATTLLRAGRYDEALAALLRVIQVEPHFAMAHATLGWAYLLSGRAADGIAELERALSLSPQSTMYLAQLGQAYARSGRTDEARAVLRRLEELARTRYVSRYHMAYVYTGLGEHDRAMDLLERAYEERDGGIYGVKGSFLFAPLRTHPRFRALLGRMNLA